MALLASLEGDLRSLSADARRKYPIIKDAADRAIFKVRLVSNTAQVAGSDDILKTFLLACESKNTRLSVMGLVGMEKLIAHDAVAPSALPSILATLKEHADMSDEIVQLKTLQTALTILQSQLYPKDEDQMAVLLGLCLRLLGNSRSSDSVHSTAVATLRQAVALIFDKVLIAEGLPVLLYNVSGGWASSSNSVAGEVSRSISAFKNSEIVLIDNHALASESKPLSKAGKLGLYLFEDLASLAGGGSASWLQLPPLQRSFALDMLEYVLSHYAVVFRRLPPFEQVLRQRVCSLLMTSLRISGELDSVVGEPAYRRLVLRSVATVTRLYNSIITTECEVFMSMLIKSIDLDLPPWHQNLVLETLRGLCVEARLLCLLFKAFDMKPENTDMVANIVQALATVVTRVELLDGSEEILAAVTGMFQCKAKGLEWASETDVTSLGPIVASEAHAVTLAAEGLLGVIFTIATLTDEAVGSAELISSTVKEPSISETFAETSNRGETVTVCTAMVNSVWGPLLEALSFIVTRSQGETIVGEIFKGYQAFTKACGVLYAVEPRDSFLASLCKFTFASQGDPNKSWAGVILSGGKRLDVADQRESVVLSSKNIQALRTLFNISHQLNLVLGPTSWILVLETLEVLDLVLHSPYSIPQDGAGNAARMRDQSSDLSILTMYDAQMFESTAKMSIPALSFFLTALRQVSNSFVLRLTSGSSPGFSTSGSNMANNMTGQVVSKMFAVERMLSTLMFNVHRLELVWDQVTAHLLELAEHENQQVRVVALDALDRAICGVLASQQFQIGLSRAGSGIMPAGREVNGSANHTQMDKGNLEGSEFTLEPENNEYIALECALIQPLSTLYTYGRVTDVRSGALKILLHILERHGEKLYQSWPSVLDLLRSVANASEKDLVPLGFQNLRVIMNDGLLSIPAHALELCIAVAGAYGAQRTDINISLTAIGSLWTTADFFARGVNHEMCKKQGTLGGEMCTQREHVIFKQTVLLLLTWARMLAGAQASENNSQFKAQSSPGLESGPQGLDRSKSEHGGQNAIDPAEAAPSDKRLDVEYDALLLAVYGVIQGLGTDERPEVRHSAIRTLFQSISSHGHKLSTAMWEQCLWNLVFPLVDIVRILASTSSKDEWHGKELGIEGGKPVHMLVHHSRNTAQKQWDETLVLVLGGISRLLKPYLKIFQTLDNFRQRWDFLLLFIHESIVNGSKEVSLAAIAAIHPVLISNSLKGNLPGYCFESAFTMYESVIQQAVQPDSRVVPKVQKELLQSLGDLFTHGQSLFATTCYLRLLALIDLFVWVPLPAGDLAAIGQVQQTVLTVLPQLKPIHDHLMPLWLTYIYQVLSYLPDGNSLISRSITLKSKNAESDSLERPLASRTSQVNGHSNRPFTAIETTNNKEEQSAGNNHEKGHIEQMGSQSLSTAFSEKIIKVVLELHHACPTTTGATGLPDIVAAFGRCMVTRRDAPYDKLWRTALKAFISVVRGALLSDTPASEQHVARQSFVASGTIRSRFWKEVADVYEKFMVGACGRAVSLPAGVTIDTEIVEADEILENTVLCFLCDELLTCCQDAPREIVHRLVGVIDRCAARTSALPLASVALLPAHCGRFSLSCLEKLFKLCSCEPQTFQESSRIIVSQIAIPVLIARCKAILHHFAEGEKEVGDTSYPQMCLEEVLFVLQELAELVLHPLTTTPLNLPVHLRDTALKHNGQQEDLKSGGRAHLLLLYTSLCGLITTRVLVVKNLLQTLLQLVGTELGL